MRLTPSKNELGPKTRGRNVVTVTVVAVGLPEDVYVLSLLNRNVPFKLIATVPKKMEKQQT